MKLARVLVLPSLAGCALVTGLDEFAFNEATDAGPVVIAGGGAEAGTDAAPRGQDDAGVTSPPKDASTPPIKDAGADAKFPAVTATGGVLRIQAHVDGLSDLVISGSKITWDHQTFLPPTGTVLNGVRWTATWPNGATSCTNCSSTDSATLTPALPTAAQTVSVTKAAGRGPVVIVTQPPTLRIEFDDSVYNNADDYDVTVTYDPN